MHAELHSNRRRKAVGPDRPSYLTGLDTDKVLAIVLALMSEVASLRERLDLHERIANLGELPSVVAVEAYRPDPIAEAECAAWRKAYIRRVFRVVVEEIELAGRETGAPKVKEDTK